MAAPGAAELAAVSGGAETSGADASGAADVVAAGALDEGGGAVDEAAGAPVPGSESSSSPHAASRTARLNAPPRASSARRS